MWVIVGAGSARSPLGRERRCRGGPLPTGSQAYLSRLSTSFGTNFVPFVVARISRIVPLYLFTLLVLFGVWRLLHVAGEVRMDWADNDAETAAAYTLISRIAQR